MIRGSIWYMEQWDKLHSPMYKPVYDASTDTRRSKYSRAAGFTSAILYSAMTGLTPSIVIASSPYHIMYSVSSDLSLGWRTAMRAEGGMLVHTTGVSRWVLGGSDDVFRLVRSRLFLAKAGARLIPGLGWALLAYDLYTVGNWYMKTDF